MPEKIKMAKVVIQIMGWLSVLLAVAFLLISIFGSVIIGISAEDSPIVGSLIVGITGFIVAVVTLGVGVLYLVTARGIVNRRNWAKVVGIVLGILALPGFPIGTVLGVLILVGLLSSESQGWFQQEA